MRLEVVLRVPVPSVEHGAAIAAGRFSELKVDGELTVWDAELRRHIVHQAPWDAEAVRDVVESLSARPGYLHLWDWSDDQAGEGAR
jgi:hypothetical protein